ncbi:MAG TPA: hypothetical protein VM345_01075 [Acidimicrobiales bacterium]|jgi:hypothetical protein|nr:hypothetical protein [Acidimicrobiales bacterium]
MRRLAPILVAPLLLLAACGAGEDPTVDVPAGDSASTSTTTGSGGSTTTLGGSSTTVDDDPAAGAGAFQTAPITKPQGSGQGLLTAVRHAAHDTYYRIVFEFSGHVPGVKVGFAERPITQDGSGDEIDVAGDRVVLVQFEPASGFDMEASKESYTGPKRLEVEQAPVVEIVRVSDFEAHLDWAVGVDRGTRFRVTTLEGPPRVVVDLSR